MFEYQKILFFFSPLREIQEIQKFNHHNINQTFARLSPYFLPGWFSFRAKPENENLS